MRYIGSGGTLPHQHTALQPSAAGCQTHAHSLPHMRSTGVAMDATVDSGIPLILPDWHNQVLRRLLQRRTSDRPSTRAPADRSGATTRRASQLSTLGALRCAWRHKMLRRRNFLRALPRRIRPTFPRGRFGGVVTQAALLWPGLGVATAPGSLRRLVLPLPASPERSGGWRSCAPRLSFSRPQGVLGCGVVAALVAWRYARAIARGCASGPPPLCGGHCRPSAADWRGGV